MTFKKMYVKKGKFDYNREIIEEIQNKKFDNSKFEELAGSNKNFSSFKEVIKNACVQTCVDISMNVSSQFIKIYTRLDTNGKK